MSSFAEGLDRFFRITERGTTVQTEIRSGIITFLAMAYILVVNPNIISAVPSAQEYGFNALFTQTALAAAISTLLMGIYARFPSGLAPGMGVNAFITYTICLQMGFDYPQALMIVLISGIVFFLFTISGYRTVLINSIPNSMKASVVAGIGLFITIIGVYGSGIIVHGDGNALSLGDLTDPGILLGLFCIITTISIWYLKHWGAVIIGIILTWIIGVILSQAGIMSQSGALPVLHIETLISSPDFSLIFAVFTDFHMFGSELILPFITAVVSLFIVDIFDTTGTILAVGREAGFQDENGNIEGAERALQCDAGGTLAGAAVGSTTTTILSETVTGIISGGRTGLMSVTIGVLFLISLLLCGLFSSVNSTCTVGALVLVGILMMRNIMYVEWKDPVICAMAFLTIVQMGLCGSITLGMAAGTFAYVGGMVLTHRKDQLNKTIWALFVLFLIYVVLNHIVIPLIL